DLMAIMNGDKGSSFVMLLFLFIIAGAGISNTMIMAVMERRKETAMLKALGFSRKTIITQFVIEGTITGIIGALLGALLAVVVMIPLSKYGIDFTSLFSADMDIGYRIPLIMRPGFYWQSFIVIPLLAVVLSALSAFFPVYKSGKEQIADLFRRA
ncbi:MAG: FtsX-like permease family protein, partial [Spirochaetales bacterium]|nr:FtsX-like permease family protein [Spirochaetales bacterium]